LAAAELRDATAVGFFEISAELPMWSDDQVK
jgi:hypothetical protein